MASGLSKRVSGIETALVLIGHLHDRLRYLQPPLTELLESALALEQLREAAYLAPCLDSMGRGVPFPTSWRTAVESHCGALGREEAELLAALGDILGSTDLDSQLASLTYTRQSLEHRLELARQFSQKHQKLYGTLGVLAGIAIVIIMV